jgi:hypothetical protein
LRVVVRQKKQTHKQTNRQGDKPKVNNQSKKQTNTDELNVKNIVRRFKNLQLSLFDQP